MDKTPVHPDSSFVNKTDEEWKKLLPADVYHVARQKGTERPFTSKFEHSKEYRNLLLCRLWKPFIQK